MEIYQLSRSVQHMQEKYNEIISAILEIIWASKATTRIFKIWAAPETGEDSFLVLIKQFAKPDTLNSYWYKPVFLIIKTWTVLQS